MALTDSLISHWRFDEASGNALDAHGSNDATEVNTPASVTGKIGNARRLQASSNEHFYITDNTDISCGDIDFTWAGWVQLGSSVASNDAILGKRASSSGTGGNSYAADYNIYMNDSGGRHLRFFVGGASLTFVESAEKPLALNTWHFFICWHDSTASTVNISVNNETPVSASAGTPPDSNIDLYFGRTLGRNQWDGIIDSVSLWKRLLTSDERSELWNSGNGLDYPFVSGGAAVQYYRRVMGL